MEYGLTQHQSIQLAWRLPLAFQAIFLVFIVVAAPFYPESPRYLAKTGRSEDARRVLTQCRLSTKAKSVDEEMIAIKDAIRMEALSASKSYYAMLFETDSLHTRRRVLLGCGVQAFQKLTGIDFIAAYAPEMFSLSGFKGNEPALLAGGNFFPYTASLALAIYFSDHVGRRKMMLFGCTVMCVVLIVGGILSHETIATASDNPAQSHRYGSGVAAILYIYTFTYGISWLTTW